MAQWPRIIITLAVAAAALVAGVWVWNYYLYSAWTRDGRIQAEIVAVASQVSGVIAAVETADGASVERGDVLFRIDGARYRAAVAKAEAKLAREKQAWALSKQRLGQRDARSGGAEDLAGARLASKLAAARYRLAKAELASRRLELQRTVVRAPASGTVVHAPPHPGSHVEEGSAVVSLMRRDSFYATGYFEETKLPLIRVGQRARIRLMAGGPTLTGRVARIARAIANPNTTADSRLLPQVQPAFSWVRLAQRIPVDIALDPIPDGVTLRAGITATITLAEDQAGDGDSS